jgi:hypothetical protein
MDGPAWDVFLFLPMQLYIELPRLFNVGGCIYGRDDKEKEKEKGPTRLHGKVKGSSIPVLSSYSC